MIKQTQLSRWMYENSSIWFNDLKNPRAISSYIRDRRVNFWDYHVVNLWRFGWVRADLIQGKSYPDTDGFDLINSNDGESLYTDNRELGSKKIGEFVSAKEYAENPPALVPYFHPFKYFVFWKIHQTMQTSIHPCQVLFPDKYHDLLDQEIKCFYEITQADNYKGQVNRWDEIARLAIAAEPCNYPQMVGAIRHPPSVTVEEQVAKIQAYKTQIKDHYLEIGFDPLKDAVEELCISAEMIDPNSDIHTLIRFLKGDKRNKTRGHLGGAILLKSMAETIRRMTEFSFDQQLPEEDEMGFGVWIEGAKQQLYGTKRIFDGDNAAKRHFMRELGADVNVRVRIYVEGETEYAAFNHIVGSWDQIEVINLRGQFVERIGKGLSFRDSLVLDDRKEVFSVIILDGDVQENISVVRQAAKAQIYCGFFSVSPKDFEFGNFTNEEMYEIIWGFLDETQKKDHDPLYLWEVVNKAKTAKELTNGVSRAIPILSQFSKGSEWGKMLSDFAIRNPRQGKSDNDRPYITAVRFAIRLIDANYQFTKKMFKVDPDTGKLISR